MKSISTSLALRTAVIVLLTFVTYIPAIHGGFVFDDVPLITQNALVTAGDGLYRFWFTREAPDYYPLTGSLWWMEWRLWGANPMGYHVVNILLHAANAVLVWIILQRLKIPGAWLTGLVFAVHPVNVATAAWISEQKNTLSMFLYALSILLYLRFDEENRWGWYALSFVAFLLALLSKPAIVMLPVVLLGCIWWRRGRVSQKDGLRSVPYFLPSLAMALVAIFQQQHRVLGGSMVRTGGIVSRFVQAGWEPWFYLSKTLWPVNLMVIYPKWEFDVSNWASYAPGIGLIGVFVLCWWKRETWGRPLLFGMGYFVVMLFPVLGFFDQGFYTYSFVADHWQYYSIAGVIALAVAAMERICRGMDERGRYVIPSIGAAVLIVLGTATWKRGCVYADSQTLWQDNVSKNPNAWVAHNNLGASLLQVGKAQEAIEHYQQALQISADYVQAHNGLGVSLFRVGRVEEAIGHFQQALRIEPDFAEAHSNLGVALVDEGRAQEAIEHHQQALRIKPDFAEAHNNLGVALLRLGRV